MKSATTLKITYSVFRLAARRTDPSIRDSVAGIRAGERKTCCAKALPPPPRLWVLNAAACFAAGTWRQFGEQRAGIGWPKRAFERSPQPGFGCLVAVQRRPRPLRRKHHHPELAGAL